MGFVLDELASDGQIQCSPPPVAPYAASGRIVRSLAAAGGDAVESSSRSDSSPRRYHGVLMTTTRGPPRKYNSPLSSVERWLRKISSYHVRSTSSGTTTA